MPKATTTKNSGYSAVHELLHNDELEGPSSIKPGQPIPSGVLDSATLERLLKKGAIKKTKDVEAEAAADPDAEPETEADKNPTAAAAESAAASAPGPTTTSRSSR